MQAQSLGTAWRSHNQGVCILIDGGICREGRNLWSSTSLRMNGHTQCFSLEGEYFSQGMGCTESIFRRIAPRRACALLEVPTWSQLIRGCTQLSQEPQSQAAEVLDLQTQRQEERNRYLTVKHPWEIPAPFRADVWAFLPWLSSSRSIKQYEKCSFADLLASSMRRRQQGPKFRWEDYHHFILSKGSVTIFVLRTSGSQPRQKEKMLQRWSQARVCMFSEPSALNTSLPSP